MYDIAAWALQRPAEMPIAPVSLGAWVALVLSIVTSIAIPVGWGKWLQRMDDMEGRILEKLNGVGGRVTKLELEAESARARDESSHLEVTRLIDQNARTLEAMGEHRRSTEVCREDTENLGIKIGSAVDELSREVHGMNNDLSNRLTRVETILTERRIGE
jgi:hypothetical protein